MEFSSRETGERRKSISVIIPCFDEEKNLPHTYENVIAAIKGRFDEYEILIFNDNSSDKTGEVAENISRRDEFVTVIHNSKNQGFGYCVKKGFVTANKEYIAFIPGDNEISGVSIYEIFGSVGLADIVFSYTINFEVRPYFRRLVSRFFTLMMNGFFQCELQYYNGPAVYQREILDQVKINTSGFAFAAVVATKLIRSGHSFIEVGMFLNPRLYGRSSAIRLKSLISVSLAVGRLFFEVYTDKRYRRMIMPKRVLPFDNPNTTPDNSQAGDEDTKSW